MSYFDELTTAFRLDDVTQQMKHCLVDACSRQEHPFTPDRISIRLRPDEGDDGFFLILIDVSAESCALTPEVIACLSRMMQACLTRALLEQHEPEDIDNFMGYLVSVLLYVNGHLVESP